MANKRREGPVPKARNGDGWVAVWQSPEVRDEPQAWETREPALIKRASLSIVSAVKSEWSPLGLGSVQLVLSSLPLGGDIAAGIAAIAGSSMAVGSAQTINKAFVHELLTEDVPTRAELGLTASRIEGTCRAIEQASLLPRTTINGYKAVGEGRWQFCAIVPGTKHPEFYGLAWLPRGTTEGLLEAASCPALQALADLSATHTLIDLLGTKRGLMRELGLTAAIELDQRIEANTRAREVA